MRSALPLAAIAWAVLLVAPAQAQIDVGTEILSGGPIALDNANATTDLGELRPFAGDARFQQDPDLDNSSVDVPEEARLFKHDYSLSVPDVGQVGGGATANDLPNATVTFMGKPVVDIAQFTMALFTDGGPGSGGMLVDPPGVARVLNPGTFISLAFTDLEPGAYTLRVAGILNGFDTDLQWHGEYQGAVAITPLPGALALFLTAIAGLGFAGWRRSRA